MKTKIINLYGAPSTGKSTIAAGLYYKMKSLNYDIELVREIAKKWAYKKRKIKKTDQIYLFNKQLNEEQDLYGTVQYLITDSPLHLASFYMEHNYKKTYLTDAVSDYLNEIKSSTESYNFFLEPGKKYNQNGRFETQEQSAIIDEKLRLYLFNNNVDFLAIDNVDQIYSYITLYTGGLDVRSN